MSESTANLGGLTEPAEVLAVRMQLKPSQENEYRRRHDEIWPELSDALHEAGVLEFQIFFDPATHALFSVMKRHRGHTLETLRDSQLMRRWWAMMSDIMETNPDLSPCEWPLQPMFRLSVDR